MNDKHVLLCVMGRTASGKDSLVNRLCERTGLKQIISYTTRERRQNEGNTHIFVTEDDYNQMRAEGNIAAFTQIGEYKYWSTIDQLYENDIYIIDYEGLKTLRALNIPDINIVSVFINVPDSIREERALTKRRDDKTKFRTRDFSERGQFREMAKDLDFDYAVSNIDFAKAFATLHWISSVEGCWKNTKQNDL